MAIDPEARRHLSAAEHRFEAAEILHRDHQRHLDSAYLAGYAVECGLKAVIVAHVPVSQRDAFVQTHFRSAKAHDFEHLKGLLDQVKCPIPVELMGAIRRVEWSTELRYQAGRGRREDAETLLTAAADVLRWANGVV